MLLNHENKYEYMPQHGWGIKMLGYVTEIRI